MIPIAAAAPRRAFVAAWIATSVVAETTAVLFGVLSIAINVPAVLAVAALEGLLLAIGQCALLVRPTGTWFTTAWAAATVAGAMLGRVVEYHADVRFGPETVQWTMPAQIAGGIALGFAVGAVMALPQALALRSRTERAWQWIAARGIAWAAALPLLLLTLDIAPATANGNGMGVMLVAVVALPAIVAGAIEAIAMMSLLADQP